METSCCGLYGIYFPVSPFCIFRIQFFFHNIIRRLIKCKKQVIHNLKIILNNLSRLLFYSKQNYTRKRKMVKEKVKEKRVSKDKRVSKENVFAMDQSKTFVFQVIEEESTSDDSLSSTDSESSNTGPNRHGTKRHGRKKKEKSNLTILVIGMVTVLILGGFLILVVLTFSERNVPVVHHAAPKKQPSLLVGPKQD